MHVMVCWMTRSVSLTPLPIIRQPSSRYPTTSTPAPLSESHHIEHGKGRQSRLTIFLSLPVCAHESRGARAWERAFCRSCTGALSRDVQPAHETRHINTLEPTAALLFRQQTPPLSGEIHGNLTDRGIGANPPGGLSQGHVLRDDPAGSD